MKMTVNSNRNDRKFEGTVVRFDKHRPAILAWLEGAEIETRAGTAYGWEGLPDPHFDGRGDREYRIAKRKPKPCEVWQQDGHTLIALSPAKGFEVLTGDCWAFGETAEYVAENIFQYHLNELAKG